MFHIFKNHKDQKKPVECFVGVAEPRYGKPFDIGSLYQGNLDDKFKNHVFFSMICEVFSDKNTAIEKTVRRAVTKDSAYVLTLKCSQDELMENIDAGFSKIIKEVLNVSTGQKYEHLKATTTRSFGS